MRRWCHLAHKNLRGKHDIDGEGECSSIEGEGAAMWEPMMLQLRVIKRPKIRQKACKVHTGTINCLH